MGSREADPLVHLESRSRKLIRIGSSCDRDLGIEGPLGPHRARGDRCESLLEERGTAPVDGRLVVQRFDDVRIGAVGLHDPDGTLVGPALPVRTLA